MSHTNGTPAPGVLCVPTMDVLSTFHRQLNSAGTPSLFFHIPCTLDAAAVRALWALGADESEESVALLLVGAAEVRARHAAAAADDPLKMTPATEGGMQLWQRFTHLTESNHC